MRENQISSTRSIDKNERSQECEFENLLGNAFLDFKQDILELFNKKHLFSNKRASTKFA